MIQKLNKNNHKIHLLKTVTWRILGTITTILISWFISGDIKTGLTIGMFELISKSLLYYFHEIMWDKLKK